MDIISKVPSDVQLYIKEFYNKKWHWSPHRIAIDKKEQELINELNLPKHYNRGRLNTLKITLTDDMDSVRHNHFCYKREHLMEQLYKSFDDVKNKPHGDYKSFRTFCIGCKGWSWHNNEFFYALLLAESDYDHEQLLKKFFKSDCIYTFS